MNMLRDQKGKENCGKQRKTLVFVTDKTRMIQACCPIAVAKNVYPLEQL